MKHTLEAIGFFTVCMGILSLGYLTVSTAIAISTVEKKVNYLIKKSRIK